MKNFTSFEEIESLCLAVVTDYMRTGSRAGTLCVDIEDLVTDYLGIPLVWETFAEPDPGRVGFFSDGKRPLEIIRKGKKQEAVFPEGTAVVDKRLLAPWESARRRFTVAHEGAHGLLARHLPAPAAAANRITFLSRAIPTRSTTAARSGRCWRFRSAWPTAPPRACSCRAFSWRRP